VYGCGNNGNDPNNYWTALSGEGQVHKFFVYVKVVDEYNRSGPVGMFLPADSSCIGGVSLHFTLSELSVYESMAAGVVVQKESEYISAPTGLRALGRRP